MVLLPALGYDAARARFRTAGRIGGVRGRTGEPVGRRSGLVGLRRAARLRGPDQRGRGCAGRVVAAGTRTLSVKIRSPNGDRSSLAAFAAMWKTTSPPSSGAVHSRTQRAVSGATRSMPASAWWAYCTPALSVIAARSPRGEIKTFPVAENIHIDNILHVSIVPARVEEQVQREAERLAARIAEGLEAVGLLAVEMFLTEDGELFVNELAPRPHNSGHYTMEACTTSQFEQHVRAICNLPLGPVELLTPVVMVNILGEHLEAVRKAVVTGQWFGEAGGETGFPVIPKVHLYGKHGAAPKRKMGHINLICRNVEDGLRWIEQTNIWRNERK